MPDGSQELVPAAEASPRSNGLAGVRVVQDAVPVLDTARFEHMQRIASIMAESSLVPEHLRKKLADCFLVTNQAVRWGMDPFAVAQCVSVVKGKLCYEGKLVAAVLDAKLGVALDYTWTGEGEAMRVRVTGTLPDGRERAVEGSVAEWRTRHDGSPWVPAQYRKMLAYRGAREWARLWAPATMLGVYAPDELEDLAASRARDITPPGAAGPPPKARPPEPRAAPKGPPPAPPAAPGGPLGVGGAPATQAPRPAAEPFPDPAAYIAHLEEELSLCTDLATAEEIWEQHLATSDGRIGREPQAQCEALIERRRAQLAPSAS